MPVGLNHDLVIERSTEGALDDYGHAARTWATLASVRGLVQPKTVREIALISDAGAVVSDHTIFLLPTDLLEADRIRHGDRLFEVRGVHDAGGASHHLEVDAQLITPDEEEGS